MAVGSDNVAEAVRDFLRNPGGYNNLLKGIEQIERIGLQEATAAATAEEGPEAAIAIETIADAVGLSVGWIVLLALSGIIVGGKLTEWVWLKAADKLPWPFGGGLRTIVHLIFGPLDSLEAQVGKAMADVSTKMIISWLKALRAFLVFELGVPLATGGGITTAQLNHVQHEIDVANAKIKKLQYEYDHLNTKTTGGIAPAPGEAPLTNRVTRLERQQLVVSHDLGVLYGDDLALNSQHRILYNQVQQIEANLNKTRTVAFSAQDVLNQQVLVSQNLQYQITQISPQINANTRAVRLLSPLGLLLVNGMPGLRNLEKLERKPCQCPQLPGLPGDDSGLLAAYEFLTNG